MWSGYLFIFVASMNIFFDIFLDSKLQLKLSDEKLQDSIVLNFVTNLIGPIDADAG